MPLLVATPAHIQYTVLAVQFYNCTQWLWYHILSTRLQVRVLPVGATFRSCSLPDFLYFEIMNTFSFSHNLRIHSQTRYIPECARTFAMLSMLIFPYSIPFRTTSIMTFKAYWVLSSILVIFSTNTLAFSPATEQCNNKVRT